MRIITISREFGSGGRELGKRLADALGIPCYDREIIDMLAEQEQLDKSYLERISESHIQTFYTGTIGHRFHVMPQFLQNDQITDIQQKEHKILRELAEKGDCVVVGRCADIILQDMNPINIFVCADEDAKVIRCQKRAKTGENLSEKELRRKMKEIDSGRKRYRSRYTDRKWGQCSAYHLCVNTSNAEIKTLIPGLAVLVQDWFQNQ